MKKRVLLALFSLGACLGVSAQNVQLHYDLGRSLYDGLSSRGSVTTTVEMFKPDKWGSTFMFTDLDYKNDGVMGAYWEIAREFNITRNKQFAAHIEYNGGAATGELPTKSYYGNRFQHAVLLGGAWNWHNADFSKTFSLQAMYKYYFKNGHTGARPFNGFQTTAVWGMELAKGMMTFSGFADLWYDPTVKGKLIFLSEPQFWFNMNKLKGWDGVNLSVGTEVEVSNNFVWNEKGENDKFYAIPTLALKWTF
ncbi:nucleoside-specific channel-forming Tsx family protein [Prevotella sp.]|uniref:nucleoside-specific channel-forming Tsx family protein n=1 Tax=Prevotella sp. TaxID=59823 RepID=UPI002F9245F1